MILKDGGMRKGAIHPAECALRIVVANHAVDVSPESLCEPLIELTVADSSATSLASL